MRVLRPIVRAALLAAIALGALPGAGCGGASYLVLEFVCEDATADFCSQLAIPDDIDMLRLRVFAAEDDEELASFLVDISSDGAFPVTVLLEPGSDRPRMLRIRVDGLSGGERGEVVAVADFDVQWQESKDNFADPPILLTPAN